MKICITSYGGLVINERGSETSLNLTKAGFPGYVQRVAENIVTLLINVNLVTIPAHIAKRQGFLRDSTHLSIIIPI